MVNDEVISFFLGLLRFSIAFLFVIEVNCDYSEYEVIL